MTMDHPTAFLGCPAWCRGDRVFGPGWVAHSATLAFRDPGEGWAVPTAVVLTQEDFGEEVPGLSSSGPHVQLWLASRFGGDEDGSGRLLGVRDAEVVRDGLAAALAALQGLPRCACGELVVDGDGRCVACRITENVRRSRERRARLTVVVGGRR